MPDRALRLSAARSAFIVHNRGSPPTSRATCCSSRHPSMPQWRTLTPPSTAPGVICTPRDRMHYHCAVRSIACTKHRCGSRCEQHEFCCARQWLKARITATPRQLLELICKLTSQLSTCTAAQGVIHTPLRSTASNTKSRTGIAPLASGMQRATLQHTLLCRKHMAASRGKQLRTLPMTWSMMTMRMKMVEKTRTITCIRLATSGHVPSQRHEHERVSQQQRAYVGD